MHKVLATVSAIAAAATLISTAGSAVAATALDVQVGAGCGKTTCFNNDGVFTKTWSSKDATGPITISQLLLDRGVLGALDSKTFRLSFKLDGKEIGSWGSFTMGGIGGDQLTFTGEDFTWNPEDGELTLVLALAPPPKAGGSSLFSLDLGPTGGSIENPTGSEEQPGGGNESGDQGPAETNLGRPAGNGAQSIVTAVPEPSAWALMISGFGMAGASMRRRRRVLSA